MSASVSVITLKTKAVLGKAISPATHAFEYVLEKAAVKISYSVENEFTLWSCTPLGALEGEDRKDRHTKRRRKQREREDLIRIIQLSKVLWRLVHTLSKAHATYHLAQTWVHASIHIFLSYFQIQKVGECEVW